MWVAWDYWILVKIIGEVRLGAQRWIDIPGFGVQPSEFMKLGMPGCSLFGFYLNATCRQVYRQCLSRWWRLVFPGRWCRILGSRLLLVASVAYLCCSYRVYLGG